MASDDVEMVASSTAAVVLWDRQDCLPLSKILSDEDIIAFLTPVVVPYNNEVSASDPFEPLGRAIAARHRIVHHVPYTLRGGITSLHVAHIKRARVVIFVISGPPGAGEPNQAEFAEIARIYSDNRPQVVVACFRVHAHHFREDAFPTIVQISDYSPSNLEEAAALLFGEAPLLPENPVLPPREWPIETWQLPELAGVHALWRQCLPTQFDLTPSSLQRLLKRDGYSMHYIVRESDGGKVVGFCATYTTFADDKGFRLVGSLAVLMVDRAFRGRGIGRSLHDHALRQLQRTKGVERMQLGSTFPRLLFGLTADMESTGWFRRRGWELDQQIAGKGQDVCDWVLRFEDLPRNAGSLSTAGLTFRRCEFDEYSDVLQIVAREAARKESMGWYDQYLNLNGTMNMSDVILGLEGSTIVATAITYTQDAGSPTWADLPWAQNIGIDCGGITCICINGGHIAERMW